MCYEPDMTLDLSGKHCPFTVMDLAGAVRSLAAGGVLEVLIDGEAGVEEVRAWCKATGRELLDWDRAGPTRVFVKKG
jgi:TusA-related sulfurtransferase